jgi:biopolymer transport protein ExbB
LDSLVSIFFGVFHDGGWVLWPIFGVSVMGLYIGLGKLVLFGKIKRARMVFDKVMFSSQYRNGKAVIRTGMVPYDSLLKAIQDFSGSDVRRRENMFREFLSDVVPELEQGFSTMSACVSVAPLLGLLGTISGMNRMFSVITDVGLGSPGLMAGGIGVALGSALAGLAVAVVVMFFHNYLYTKKTDYVQALMKDGAKLVRGAYEHLN